MIPDRLLENRQWALADLMLLECAKLRLVKFGFWDVHVLTVAPRQDVWSYFSVKRKNRGTQTNLMVDDVRGAGCTLLAREGSWAWKRAPWGRKVLWVVKDNEGEDGSRIYPSGKYVPQTREEPEESLNFWSKEDKSVVDEDILLYITLGMSLSFLRFW